MILAKDTIFDGFSNLADGVDAGRNPSLIGKTQCASAENMVVRGGEPRTGPGFDRLTLGFSTIGIEYDANGIFSGYVSPVDGTVFFGGIFQGAVYYSPGSGKPECIMVMIGGRLFQLTPQLGLSSGVVTHMNVLEVKLDKINFATLPRAYLVQADRFCVIQDGQSKPIIYDGVTARRANVTEVPIGTIMAYGMGRLVVAVNDNREIMFSDLYGSNEDSNDPGAAVLSFTETTFLNEGGNAALNFSMGKIKALVFPSQQDTSTGDGELLVGAEGGMAHFHVSLPREQWKDSAFAQLSLVGVGVHGDRAVASVNGDVWFRGDDGWRSYRQARSEQSGWAHLPMSTNVRTWTDSDTPEWLDYGSAINFDNQLICTCTPQPNSWRVFHNGLLSLDFDVLSSFGEATRPAWNGNWTRLRTQQLVTGMFAGVERAFSLGLQSEAENVAPGQLSFVVTEISKNGSQDGDDLIPWELVTRSFDFNSPYNEKELFGADIWVDEVKNDVTISVEYRPDQHPVWTTWQTLPVISPVGTAQAITPGGVPTLLHNFAPRRTIIKPENVVDDEDFTGRSMRRGFEFQVRLRGTGHCALRKLRLHAKQLVEDDKAKVP